jgi:membrane protease YdiL (CAAX protease family)
MEAPAAVSRVRPANQLFLLVLLLLLAVGAPVQLWRIWPGVVVTELAVILLPTVLFARKTGSMADALRLRWTGWGPCCLGLGLGLGTYPLAGMAGALATKLLGYTIDERVWQLPTNAGQAAMYLLGAVLLAPLCEETLFRGYMLTAYERAGWPARTSVLVVTGLFAAFHLSAVRFPVVVVLGLAITYAAWRAGSIWPAIAAHMGANGAGSVLVLTRHVPAVQHINTMQTTAISMLVTATGVLCLLRMARLPEPPKQQTAAAHPKGNGWGALAAAMAIVALAVTGEIVLEKFPNLATRTVTKTVTENQLHAMEVKESWTAPVRWWYEISSQGRKVGDAEYEVRPNRDGTTLSGTVRLAPKRVISIRARWDHGSMKLRRFSVKVTGEGRKPPVEYRETSAPVPQAWFEGGMYSPYELPWRLAAAAILDDRHNRDVVLLENFREAPLPNESGFYGEYRVEMDPKLETADGVQTVKLKMQNTEAWYAAEAPHSLVRLRDGATEWRLVSK